MTKTKTEALLMLTKLRKTMAMAELATIRGKVVRQEWILGELREKDASVSDVAFKMTGADVAWRAWRSGQERQLLTELYDLKAKEADAKAALRQRVGQDAALRAIRSFSR